MASHDSRQLNQVAHPLVGLVLEFNIEQLESDHSMFDWESYAQFW